MMLRMGLLEKALRDFKEIEGLEHVVVDLKYATSDNFLGENVYGKFNRAFLHPHAYEKLLLARTELQSLNPGYKLIIFDALRPFSIHLKLFEKVRGTPEEIYVAHPDRKSVHNFGMAIDLSVLDSKGRELDMGTPFDTFSKLSQPQLEDQLLKEGLLSPEHIQNRKLLRGIMEKSGFIQLAHEWWHYDAAPGDFVRSHYDIFE